MTLKNRYIGVENEFQTFAKGKKSYLAFGDLFDSFKKSTDYSKSSTSIRTDNGLGYYVDGMELEIVTPPVALNKGFATRLTDLLMIGRDRLIEHREDLKHTGYSMHWNVTKLTSKPNPEFYKGIAVPFHLFGLTPLSGGLNVRQKYLNMKRYEVLGDSLMEEDQINATALLLGAHSYAIDSGEKFPLTIINWKGKAEKFKYNRMKNLFLPDGRYSHLRVVKDLDPAANNLISSMYSSDHHTNGMIADFESIIIGQNSKKIYAQQYLEMFYQWLHPFVKALGTKEEIQNLEGFITGEKKLEFDKFKYFAYLRDIGGKSSGTYRPTNPELPNQVIQHSGKERKVPLEGKLLGEIVKKKHDYIETFEWGCLTSEFVIPSIDIDKKNESITELNGQKLRTVEGIDNIYKHAEFLNPELKFKGSSIKAEKRKPNPVNNIPEIEPLEYKLEEDKSIKNFTQGTFKTSYKYLRSISSGQFLKYIAILGGAMLLSTCTAGIMNSKDTAHQVNETIKKYRIEQMQEQAEEKKPINWRQR